MAEQSRFEQIMGDSLGAFHLMVEGALKDYPGIYDVLLPDIGGYLVGAKRNAGFGPLCFRIRQLRDGEDRCLRCDIKAAVDAGRQRKPLVYPCHAGLMDITVPIIVHKEVVAAILCGQVRLDVEGWDSAAIEAVRDLERELNLVDGELTELYFAAPKFSEMQLSEMANRINTMARFTSRMLENTIDLQDANDLLRQGQQEQQERHERGQRVLSALEDLVSLSETQGDLWQRVTRALHQTAQVLDANAAAILLQDRDGHGKSRTTLKVGIGLPATIMLDTDYAVDPLLSVWKDAGQVYHAGFPAGAIGSLFHDLEHIWPPDQTQATEVTAVRMQLGKTLRGILIYFSTEKRPKPDPDEEQAILNLVASRVAQAYNNTNAFLAQVLEEDKRREWMKLISHQSLSPLNGAVGWAAYLLDKFSKWHTDRSSRLSTWTEEEVQTWENSLVSLLGAAEAGANVTRNMAVLAEPDESGRIFSDVDLSLITDVPEFFVRCVRGYQGLARERELKIHVDTDSVKALNNRLLIHEETFRQALQNLLDNAIKYSDRGTEVLVDGLATNGHNKIRVANIGIVLRPEDCDRIFEKESRTREAQARDSSGKGMGLWIARRLIVAQRGTLRVEPSERTTLGWRTIFTITLPMQKARSR